MLDLATFCHETERAIRLFFASNDLEHFAWGLEQDKRTDKAWAAELVLVLGARTGDFRAAIENVWLYQGLFLLARQAGSTPMGLGETATLE